MGAKEDRAHELQRTLADTEAKFSAVKEYASEEAERACTLEALNAELQRSNAELQAANGALGAEVEALRGLQLEVESLRLQLQAASAAESVAQQHVVELQVDVQSMRLQLQAASSADSAAHQHVVELQAEVARLRAVAAASGADEKAGRGLREAVAVRETQLAVAQRRVRVVEDELEALRREADELRDFRRRAKGLIDAPDREVRRQAADGRRVVCPQVERAWIGCCKGCCCRGGCVERVVRCCWACGLLDITGLRREGR